MRAWGRGTAKRHFPQEPSACTLAADCPGQQGGVHKLSPRFPPVDMGKA